MEKEDLEDLLAIALERALEKANALNDQEVSSSARQFIPGL
jgi:DNA-binding protein YbaB